LIRSIKGNIAPGANFGLYIQDAGSIV
jgi:hypothetical protein